MRILSISLQCAMKVISLLLLLKICNCYKMVFLVPELSNSQVIFNKRVAETLADAGHDVTMVILTMFEGEQEQHVKINQNVRVHRVNATTGFSYLEAKEAQSRFVFADVSPLDPEFRHHASKSLQLFSNSCSSLARNKQFLSWLENEEFDLAFAHMYHPCPIGIVHQAKIPAWIWLNSGALMDFVAYNLGVPIIPSYVPPMLMESQDVMSFVERTKSLVGHTLMYHLWPRLFADPETAIFREEFGTGFPDLMDLARNCPLVMVNSNELYDLPRPSLAKIVNIGGIGAQLKDAKPLPKDLKRIVSSGEGTVVFSFGSVAPSHKMPLEWKNALLAAFQHFPNHQFVLRYEGSDLNDRLPANVHLFKWMPQSDILQHPKTKAIITHAGYNTLQEAISAGKPMVAIPLFGDQPKNSKIAEKHGIAVVLRKTEMTEEKLAEALKRILTDDSYSTNVRRLSEMVKNQPIPAEMLIVRWAEFLAKFQKLDNLVPAGQHLNFVQYHSLDVIAFLGSVVLLLSFVVYNIIRCTCNCLCCRKQKLKTA